MAMEYYGAPPRSEQVKPAAVLSDAEKAQLIGRMYAGSHWIPEAITGGSPVQTLAAAAMPLQYSMAQGARLLPGVIEEGNRRSARALQWASENLGEARSGLGGLLGRSQGAQMSTPAIRTSMARPAPQPSAGQMQTMPRRMQTQAPIDEAAKRAFLAQPSKAPAALGSALKRSFKKGAKKTPAKKKEPRVKKSDVLAQADVAGLQKKAAAGDNYAGTLLNLILNARRQAHRQGLPFIPIRDYKDNKIVLVRADGVDMVFDMKDARRSRALKEGLARAGYSAGDVMQLADETSKQLMGAIARDINTEEDVINALESGYI
tara:strand:- start:96 stop:1049 length:954 start_codon:yes stop_codon:yes gene_type:complete